MLTLLGSHVGHVRLADCGSVFELVAAMGTDHGSTAAAAAAWGPGKMASVWWADVGAKGYAVDGALLVEGGSTAGASIVPCLGPSLSRPYSAPYLARI